MKKFFVNLGYIIEINVIMALCHAFTFIPIAFNDTGICLNNIFEAIPFVLKGNLLLILVSICMGYYYKKNPNKEGFEIKLYGIMQTIIVMLWVIWYFSNLVK